MNPLKILYEDDTLLVVDKPAGVAVFKEGEEKGTTVADLLLEQFPSQRNLGEQRRYGIVHRLDKDTSGALLVAKSKDQFEYLQKQFQARNVEKKYLCLATGSFKEKEGVINALLGRAPGDKRKQKGYLPDDPESEGKREALTLYKVLEEFPEYALLEITPKTGRKHQIRAHLAFVHHPLAGDKLYGYKGQEAPEGLNRQFLHAEYLKITLQNGETKEFRSPLPKDLEKVLQSLRNTKNI
ncbi:MAG: RluA family pseudouridine synthase [Candidatus Wildermuthbacteria bacterium]|nr:RluA family pseudouridine synthase [Candidatus Wildermuthbacteria bacterium]